VIFRHARFVILVLASLMLVACSRQDAAQAPDPLASLQTIPPANSTQYEHVRDMKGWQNPYLIVRSDGVALLDVADSAEIILKPNELLPALAKLPPSNWPYGRVVAAADGEAKSSAQDQVAVRRNKGIVGGLLTGAHIAVRWVPSA